MGVAEWVREVRYEGVGGVEECVECDGVDCAEEEDDGDGGESSVSDVGHDDDDGWRRACFLEIRDITFYVIQCTFLQHVLNTSGIHVVIAFLHLYFTTIPGTRE